MPSERECVFDIMKGFGIFLVVLGHVVKNYELGLFSLPCFIYSFHMPLFFFVSGMLYHKRKDFLKNISIKLGVPYISFAFLSYAYWFFVESKYRSAVEVEPLAQFTNIFFPMNIYGGYAFNVVLWFLPALFFCTILFYLFNKICKGRLLFLMFLILLVVIYDSLFYKLFIPFYIPQALCALPFFAMGNVFQQYRQNHFFVSYKKISFVTSVAILLILGICSPRYDMLYSSYYGLYILFALGGGLGSLSMYFISQTIGSNKLMQWLGMNSLVIMLVHEPIKRIVIKIYSQLTNLPVLDVRSSLLHILICTILTIGCVAPFGLVIKTCAPFLLGKKIA